MSADRSPAAFAVSSRERRRELLAARGETTQRSGGSHASRASVIVVVRNGAAVIERCLEHLLAQSHPGFEVVVIDDGSTDATGALARRCGDPRLTVHDGQGTGISAARNTGLARSRGAFVAFVDADGYPEPGWLAAACAALEGEPSLGAVASLVFFDRAPGALNGAGGTMDVCGDARDICFGEPLESARIPREVLYPMGNGMVFRREALEEIGGFDETFTYRYDDVDAGIRLWRAGWRVAVAPGAVIDHGYGQATQSDDASLLHQTWRIRTVLAHARARSLPRFVAGEMPWLVIPTEVRGLMRSAWARNARDLAGIAAIRREWRRRPPIPRHLLAPGRSKLPESTAPPRPPRLYGWYDDPGPGGSHWVTRHAGLLLRLDEPAAGVALGYRLPPRSPGATLALRPAGGGVEPTERTDLRAGGWRTAELRVALEPGEHEVLLSSTYAYEDARRRRLAVAVGSIEPLR